MIIRNTILRDPAPAAAPPTGGAPAPAAPPAAPPTPQGTPPAGGDDGPGAQDNFDSTFKDLDDPTPAPATPPQPAPGTKPPTPPSPNKGGTPTPPKPGIQEFEDVDGIQVPKFKSDKEFRGWGLNGYKKAKQLETEITGLNTKIQELTSKVPKNPDEAAQLAARIKTLEETLTKKEETVRFLNYEKSDEFASKYQKPYRDALASASADIKELTVTEPDTTKAPDANGVQPTRERPATVDDFNEIYDAQLGIATKLANQKFGSAAPIVLGHRAKIRELAKASVTALDEWKTKGAERDKLERERLSAENVEIQRNWTETNKRFSEDPRSKDWWGETPEDKDLNAELNKGFEFADQRFSDAYEKMSVRERITLDAAIRHRVAGFYVQRLKVKRLSAEVEALKKEIADLRDSGEPGKPRGTAPGGGGATPPAGEEKSPMENFDEKFQGA